MDDGANIHHRDLLGGGLTVRVSVIGFIIGGHLTGIPVLQLIEVERPAGVIDDAGLVTSPARIGEPDGLTFFVCEWFGVFDGGGFGVKVGDVQCSTGNLPLESFLKFIGIYVVSAASSGGIISNIAQSRQMPSWPRAHMGPDPICFFA